MRKIYLLPVLCFVVLAAAGQNQHPEEIKSIVVEDHDSTYYAEQTKAWEVLIERNPHDESAWRNCYLAAFYLRRYNNNDTTCTRLLRQMKTAIPDSYSYYYCSYREMQGGDDARTFAEEAMKRIPQKGKDVDVWTAYLLMLGNDKRLPQMAEGYYNSGIYSPSVLQYNYNELQGMKQGGIYVGNGDALLIPKILLQYGKKVHQDKIIVIKSFLMIPDYCKALFSRLGIDTSLIPDQPKANTQADFDAYDERILEIIRDNSHRPMYFPAAMWKDVVPSWENQLYNEGLTVRYSTAHYNNMAVKMYNVEHLYLLEYLSERFYPDTWDAASRLNVNYAVALSDLLPMYKSSGNKEKYSWLKTLLEHAVRSTFLTDSEKKTYLDLLK